MIKRMNAALRDRNAQLSAYTGRQRAAIHKEITNMKRSNDAAFALRMYALGVLLPCIVLVIIGIIACATAHAESVTPAHVVNTQQHEVRVSCFDKAVWGPARDALRPCTTIVAPDNDEVRVIQGSAQKEQAECVINIESIEDAYCYRISGNRGFGGLGYTWDNPHGMRAACTSALHLCAVTGGPAEDGSVAVTIYAYGHRVERCTLGNPLEERGQYDAPCVR